MRIGLPIALLAAPLVALCINPVEVRAHGEAEGIIKERMEVMTYVGREMKCISRMMRSNTPLDSAKIAEAAGNIGNHAKRMNVLFPKGSNGGVSRASKKIWENWDIFLSSATKMVNVANQLEQTAKKGDESDIRTSFGSLGKTCGTCHNQFRTEKKNQKGGI